MNAQYPFFKTVFFTALLWVIVSGVRAERIFSVVFDQIPKDNQMYARDDQNFGSVPVSGHIEINGFTHMSMSVYKEGQTVAYSKSILEYKGSSKAPFSMISKIKAELAEYTIEIYACRSGDSTLLTTRTKIIAGDFYIINGQSNAAAVVSYQVTAPEYVNKYSRTLGRTPDNYIGFTAADTLWKTPDWVTPAEGYWGRDLQRQIIETYRIPVCVINGAIPGTNIAQHLDRNESNPQNPGTLYGHLLYRVAKSQATRVRGFFWYQGEEDAWNSPDFYSDRFDRLMKYWQADYPMVDKFIIVQINIMDRPHYASGALRDFQRRTKYLYPKTDHFTVMGLGPLVDNIHYTPEGYARLAKQLSNYLGPKVYQAASAHDVDAPDIQKIFYSKSKDAITLVFDENQTMKWQTDTVYDNIRTELKNQFFLDGDESRPAPISSWAVAANRITVHFTEPVNATRLNYLRSYKEGYYHGPFLYNTNGVGAFSFHEVAIYAALNDPNLSASVTAVNTVQLQWKTDGTASYILEKKKEGQSAFTLLKTFDQNTTGFEDTDVAINTSYTYRLKGISDLSETPIAEAVVKTMSLLGTEPLSGMEWNVYPNPTRDFLDIDFKKTLSGTLSLTNITGQNIYAVYVNASSKVKIDLAGYASGLYIVTFTKKNGEVIQKRIVRL
jgi:hypothetical protein